MHRFSHPGTAIGSLSSDLATLKNELNRKADDHEIHSLSSKVDSLECSMREIRSETDELRYRLQALEEGR